LNRVELLAFAATFINAPRVDAISERVEACATSRRRRPAKRSQPVVGDGLDIDGVEQLDQWLLYKAQTASSQLSQPPLGRSIRD
jgi:hypothetical protein